MFPRFFVVLLVGCVSQLTAANFSVKPHVASNGTRPHAFAGVINAFGNSGTTGNKHDMYIEPGVDAPVTASDISTHGIRMTGSSAGYVYVGDIFGFTANCTPPPHAYLTLDVASGLSLPGNVLKAITEGLFTYRFTAFNRVDGVQYSAYIQFSLTIRSAGIKNVVDGRLFFGTLLAYLITKRFLM